MARKRARQVPAELVALRESWELAGQVKAFYRLRESLATLELQAEDAEWRQLLSTSQREFSTDGLRNIMRLCRIMFLKNPLINRAVLIQSWYVWGQGCTVKVEDDEAGQAIVDAFMSNPQNQVELTGHQARTQKEQDLQTFGNLFLVMFAGAAGDVVARSIPPEEIDQVITNPEDAKEPWAYKRTWSVVGLDGTAKPMTRYYPALNVTPEALAALQAQYGEERLTDAHCYHVKVGALSDMRMGLPEVYQAIDWARAYKGFLEDWASINRALSKFAWNMKTPGGAKGVQAAQARMNTTVSPGRSETNPPPVAGATWIGAGVEMAPFKTAGAQMSAEEGRRLLLMVAAATGLPETFYGDVSTGNLATAKTLDRPTELKFLDRQQLWAEVLQVLLSWVIMTARSRSAISTAAAANRPKITVTFPPILEHDTEAQVRAIVSAATLDGKQKAGTIPLEDVARMVLTALGVHGAELERILAAVAVEEDERQARADEMAAAIASGQAGQAGPGDNAGAGNGNNQGGPPNQRNQGQVEALRESARELRAAISCFYERAKRAA